jgi:hypothetical protein
LPDVPTLAEQGIPGIPGIEIDGWQALFATRSVPASGADRLRRFWPTPWPIRRSPDPQPRPRAGGTRPCGLRHGIPTGQRPRTLIASK